MTEHQHKPIIRSHVDLSDIGSRSHAQIDELLLIGIPSNPPAGYKKVVNIYWNPVLEEIVAEPET